jgi:hypothetical protein
MKNRPDLEAKAKGMIPKLIETYKNHPDFGKLIMPVCVEPCMIDTITQSNGRWIYRYRIAKGRQWLTPWGSGAYCNKTRTVEADITP